MAHRRRSRGEGGHCFRLFGCRNQRSSHEEATIQDNPAKRQQPGKSNGSSENSAPTAIGEAGRPDRHVNDPGGIGRTASASVTIANTNTTGNDASTAYNVVAVVKQQQ